MSVVEKETIAGIATALSEGGIGIIRVSGKESISIVDKIFRTSGKNFKLSDQKSHTIHYGYVYEKETRIDEVLVSLMKGPKSYTAEDVVEVNCHGGVLVLQKVLELLIKNGARLAKPGEFTKRAFLNGRIDLTEAEAVMDMIQAKNEFSLEASMNQLQGGVSSIIKEIRADILFQLAFIESALDDPENYDFTENKDIFNYKIKECLSKVKGLLDHSEEGKLRKDGINTVILGKPNAGKSSFLNLLVGEEKAIVTEIAGTTRDVLEESIRFKDMTLNLMDTAGIRETEDKVEKIGVERARKLASRADLLLYIVDGSEDLDESDEEIITFIKDKKNIVLLNKSDLETRVKKEDLKKKLSSSTFRILNFSALHGKGKEELGEAIRELFFQGKITMNHDEVMITNLRHKEALLEAEESLNLVLSGLESDVTEDFLTVDMMSAYSSLGRIIGEEVEEDLVNEIFSKFCMGK